MFSAPLNILETLKSKAGKMACNSVFYDWSLNTTAPDRLVVKPVDPWLGDAVKAQELLDAAGVADRTGPAWYAEWWMPEGADDVWVTHMHGFGWLRDLRTLGTPVAREQGRLMLENWVENHSHWDAQTWRPDLTGRRLSMWICHADFFCDGSDVEFEEQFLASIVKQAKHLTNILNAEKSLPLLESIKGLLYAGIALEGYEKWIETALAKLTEAIQAQILSDGGHASRSPATLLYALEAMVDIRSALHAGAYPVPDGLNETIDMMSSALRLFRYRDRKLGVFHGTQEGDVDYIDSVLAQAGTQVKSSTSLEETGFERVELGRSVMVMDTGKAPNAPYDKTAHAAPLAFEFSYGKERLLVSCGAHPSSPEWQEALRFTGGHNTACLDQRNACEIKKDGSFGRKVTKTTCHREENDGAVLIIASHNGYSPLNGITHTRKIYLANDGDDMRGQDDFSCAFDLVNPVDIATRFHVHPNVTMSTVNDGAEILLRMPGGIGWRFKQSGGTLKIEDSMYLGQGIEPRKTKQIVLNVPMESTKTCLKWSFKREG